MRKLIHVGTIDIPTDTVDITDPCYNKDVWCRTTKNIKPGKYNCYIELVLFGYYGENCSKPDIRVGEIIIGNADKELHVTKRLLGTVKSWTEVDSIGVDAGLAGFFVNKPDFNDGEWYDFCEYLDEENNQLLGTRSFIRKFNGNDGFFSESGLGDGYYKVFSIKNAEGENIAFKISFA